MIDPLDTPLRELFAAPEPIPGDPAATRAAWDAHTSRIDRIVRVIELDRGVDYHTALQRLHEAAESARIEAIGKPATLRRALSWACQDSDEAGDRVRMLDQSAQALGAADKAAHKKLKGEKTFGTPIGVQRVVLSQKSAADPWIAEDGTVLKPKKFAKRLARARAVDPSYEGLDGRQRFVQDDLIYLSGGEDLVRTLELPIERAAAADRVARVAGDLQAIVDDNDGLVLLDSPKGIGRELLKGPTRRVGPEPAKDGTINRGLDQRVRAKLTELELPESQYAKALESVLREEGVR